jgi:hypothetical protein
LRVFGFPGLLWLLFVFYWVFPLSIKLPFKKKKKKRVKMVKQLLKYIIVNFVNRELIFNTLQNMGMRVMLTPSRRCAKMNSTVYPLTHLLEGVKISIECWWSN